MNEPKLRFKADDGKDFPVWKEQYLSNIASFHSGLTYAPDDVVNDGSGVLVFRSSNIQNGQICYDDNVYVNIELKEQDYVKLHDIVVCVRNGSKSLVGKNALVTESDLNATWGAFMTVIRAKHNYEFVHQYLNSALFKKEMYKDSGTATINQITAAMLNDCKLSVPSLPEQQKIASLFSNLDTLIQSAEKELEGYRELKQGMLQKMFPKKGELIPEIRFSEFSGEWKKYELGDVLNDMYNGQTPSRSKPNYWNGDVKWLSSGELNRQTVYDSIESITEEGRKSANLRIIPKGTFVMAITGLEAAGTRGNCALLGFNTTLNQSCMALFPNENLLTTKFLFQWYKNVGEEYGITYTQGTKQQSYNAQLLEILPISLPTIKEQNKITCLLEEIDNLIALQQQELDGYKELKKGLLQQMFC